MIPPPSRSTLFPYTTLFRSPTLSSRTNRFSLVRPLSSPRFQATGGRDDNVHCDVLAIGGAIFDRGKNVAVDRKSTRLNSSHRCISYAVFCLKKKNDNHHVLI